MKFGRRAFLQFAAGAVGGTLLSPLPWQLAGDSARWSQNWSWRPSPERGEITRVPTVCTMCEGGCGIQARLVNGNRAILLEGNPANPVTRGGICALGASGLQYLYAPYRINQPLKQTKGRGNLSGFQAISWEEAIAELGKKMAVMRGEGKSHTVACITSARPSSMDDLWAQFFSAFGSSNFFKMPSWTDSNKVAALLTTGNGLPFTFALEKVEYILSFGANLLESACAPNRMFATLREWKQGGKSSVTLVQIESRCSITASKADQFLAVAPGTEAALAMGIAHLMVTSGTFDSGFVKDNVFGFEDWTDSSGKRRQGFKTAVSSPIYSPDEVAKKTGLDAARIREIAKEFASRKSALAIWGFGAPDTANNTWHELAFVALNALKGNLKPNGLINLAADIPLAGLPPVQKDAIAEKAGQQMRLDLAKGRPLVDSQNGLYRFLDAVVNGPKYPIEMLLVHEANPVYSLSETKIFQAALEKIPTLISFSSFMDETSSQADLVLPNHTAFERYDDVKGIPGAPFAYYAVSAPILKPIAKTKHSGDALLAVSANIGGSVAASIPWKTYEDFLKFRVDGLAQAQKGAVADKPGIELSALGASGSIQPNFKDGADLWKKLKGGASWYNAPAEMPAFTTPSGKFEFACQAVGAKGSAPADDLTYLPHFAPLKPAGSESEFPLFLVSYQSAFITSGYLANPPFMNKLIPDSMLMQNDIFIDLHPQTAKSLNFAQGDSASLRTTQGEASVRINITPKARPGVVFMPKGLGHKAYDEYIQNKGANANSLMEVQLDPVSGMGTVWATRAQLRRV
ncbi:MAG: molybdopterin-dependent oxidoreductase [Syntrophobacteraceae bacterium]